MTLLVLSGIRKSFGAVDVLHGVDLTVEAGELVLPDGSLTTGQFGQEALQKRA